MTIKVNFINKEHSIVKVVLQEGDIIVDQIGPKEFFISYTKDTPLFNALFPNSYVDNDGNLLLGVSDYTIEDYKEVITVPNSVMTYRAKIVLATSDMPSTEGLKILTVVNEFIDGISDPMQKVIVNTAFNGAPELFRSSFSLNVVSDYLKSLDDKVTDEFIDNLFIAASKLTI